MKSIIFSSRVGITAATLIAGLALIHPNIALASGGTGGFTGGGFHGGEYHGRGLEDGGWGHQEPAPQSAPTPNRHEPGRSKGVHICPAGKFPPSVRHSPASQRPTWSESSSAVRPDHKCSAMSASSISAAAARRLPIR